ncbi:XRE family transcriptional regulator [Methylolobus aquaticus]
MALDYRMVARKLQEARELLLFFPSEVAEGTGISEIRLRQIEAEEVRPSGDEVLILSSFYRHDFRDFLDDGRPAPFEQTEILYRRHGDAFTPQDRRAIQEFLYLCEVEASLEQELGIARHSFFFAPQGTLLKGHGERAARALRTSLGYASNAIPRDVFEDFRRIGLHVFRRRLANSEISGLYIEHPIAGHCILVNYDEDIYRQRFSVAHEAAHAIFDSSEAVMVSYRPRASRYDPKDLKEIRANRFASCFLMPPDQLPKVSNWTAEQSIQWAQQFRVSTTALSIALAEAGRIDQAAAKMIRSVRVPRAEKVDPEAPDHLTGRQQERRRALLELGLSDHYVNLCFDAYQGGVISAGRLGEVLLADHDETREISALYGRAIRHGH